MKVLAPPLPGEASVGGRQGRPPFMFLALSPASRYERNHSKGSWMAWDI